MIKAERKNVEDAAGIWGALLTQWGFVLLVALVIARALMSEVLREATEAVPGSAGVPRGVTAAASVLLDLLCWIPAGLVLLRGVIERDYAIQVRWTHGLLGAFALLALASTFWSADAYAALVNALHIVTAALVLWAASQLVRSWLRLRMVAALCFGLLLAYLAQGFYYRYVDAADTAEYWRKHKSEILAERGWTEDSFEARQFEKQITNRAMLGFNQSPNSYAAVIVLLAAAAAGLAMQRASEGQKEPAWAAGVVIVPVLIVLAMTGSRTAFGTMLIGAGLLALVWWRREWLARNPGRAYLVGVIAALVVAGAVVGHGIYHGTLPSDSLAFRWRYWVASWRVFQSHEWVGVGWANFGYHYLGVRLPMAAEEIKDPHNYVVRGFVELGIAGGVLLLAWVAMAAWELTRPVSPPASAKASRQARRAWVTLAAAAFEGIVINVIFAIDWRQDGAWVALEALRRVMFMGAIFGGALLLSARSLHEATAEEGPAPWALYGLVVAVALFFIHNLVDFSLAEPGPLMMFAALLGAALGVRTTWGVGRWQKRWVVGGAMGLGAIVWLGLLMGVAIPMWDSEADARAGDEAIRSSDLGKASALLRRAFERMPLNADYAFRAARTMIWAKEKPQKVRYMLEAAAASNPMDGAYRRAWAMYEMSQPSPDGDAVRRNFEKAIKLDPNSVALRVDCAQALEKLGDPAGAAAEYHLALMKNEQLHPDEPRRLSPGKVEEVRRKISELGGK